MTRDEVNTYPILLREKRWLEERCAELRARIDSPRIPRLTGQPGAHNTMPGSAQERMADDYMDAAPKYEAKLREVTERLTRIEAAIDALPVKERLAARLHCMERMPYKAVGEAMGYSVTSICAFMQSAYKLLEEQEKI